ncbi:tetratricopeptide repeat protein [Umezawaea beigongshangensis]|uniref:tetratricopeptide repeat protein n=1 Tax=Umezawaea beigongshangensis TaxID=2780383 RepID=UPI0018F1A25B|nr:tetratricopeptide repeat protein [Umezawaea beigongshangensis]
MRRPERRAAWYDRVDLRGALAVLLSGVAVQMFSGVVSDKVLSPRIKNVVSYPAIALTVLSGLALIWFAYRRVQAVPDSEDDPPQVAAPSGPPRLLWNPPETELLGREDDLRAAVERASADRLVAVVGPRDIGTSAVAAEVVRELPADDVEPGVPAKYRLDLRSRSSQSPEEVRVVVTRLLEGFGVDVPARDDDAAHASAADRLLAELRGTRTVLLLDQVSSPDQVRWLVDELGAAPDVTLVIAGEQAVADAVRESDVVHVGPLSTEDGARLLLQQLGRPGAEPADDAERNDVHRLVAACLGRPRAIRDVAAALTGPAADWTLAELAAAVTATADTPGDVFRVRLTVLARIRASLSRDAVRLMEALAALPVTELPPEAVTALVPAGPGDPLRELTTRDLVRYVPPGRYRMPQEVRWAVRHGVGPDERRARSVRSRAVARLVRHYADLAEARAADLVVPGTAGVAGRWFRAEEALLLELLRQPDSSAGTFPDLCRVADALDVWHSREKQGAALLAAANGLAAAAARHEDPTVQALAGVRRAAALRMAGRSEEAEVELGKVDGRRSSVVAGREQLAWALLHVERAERARRDGGTPASVQDVLLDAERSLRHCLELLPRVDLAAQVCARLNLGVVRLLQGQPIRAAEHLTRAGELATAADDWSARAHVTELLGVTSWRRRRPLEAVRRWRRALDLYRELAEDDGAARCLAHLGSAALHDGEVAALVRGDTSGGALSGAEASAVARPMLLESLWLRAGQPPDAAGTVLVKRYLAESAKRGGHPGLTSSSPGP